MKRKILESLIEWKASESEADETEQKVWAFLWKNTIQNTQYASLKRILALKTI